jgi:outer membrane protein OmpA-like peptidoglycan-associated protein
MRFKLLVVATATLVAGCAAQSSERVCNPLLSLSGPAYQCSSAVAVAEEPPPPEPEPQPEPEPEPEPERVTVTDERIEIEDVVQFEFDSAILLEESKRLLSEVARVMEERADIRKVEIGGHTDSQGRESYNRRLSEQRAQAVRDYLVSQGISRDRLTAKGFGPSQPIASNDTEDGRFQNRRVEFKILERE